MRLLPRSLFGRLVLILIVGLILAQTLGSLLLLRDRDRILQQRLGFNMIQRISGLVRLVERIPDVERGQLVHALEAPGFRVDREVPVINPPGIQHSRPDVLDEGLHA